jgi:hypothetical protein
LTGFEAIKAFFGTGDVETMNQIKRMKATGYGIRTDENGVWSVPVSEAQRFANGGKAPAAGREKKTPDAPKGGAANDGGQFSAEFVARGQWKIVGPGAEDFDGTYTKKEADAMVKELNASADDAPADSGDEETIEE